VDAVGAHFREQEWQSSGQGPERQKAQPAGSINIKYIYYKFLNESTNQQLHLGRFSEYGFHQRATVFIPQSSFLSNASPTQMLIKC